MSAFDFDITTSKHSHSSSLNTALDSSEHKSIARSPATISILGTTMCQGIQQIYASCGHERTVEITQPCPLFSNHPSHPPCTLHIIYTKTISEPLRCTECSRRVERNVIKEFEIKIAQCEMQVQSLMIELQAEIDRGKRVEMRKRKVSWWRRWGI